MITYKELAKKHYILQVKRVDVLNTDEPFTSFEGFYIECGLGWVKLLDKLCTDIEKELNKDEEFKKTFQISCIKEKYGGLRFYTYSITDKVDQLIHDAEKKSFTICEKCGDKGQLLCIRGWMSTLCSKHGMECVKSWEEDLINSMLKTKVTIELLSVIQRTMEENKELNDAKEWFDIGNEQLKEIVELKKKLYPNRY